MSNTGKVHYGLAANTDAMNFGHIAAVHRLVARLGLPSQFDQKLHLPYHESDHVLNIAYNVLCGGTRLERKQKYERLTEQTRERTISKDGCSSPNRST